MLRNILSDPPIAYSIHQEMLLVTIVGGMGTVFGPLIGAFVLHIVNEVARHFIDTPGLSLIVYGFILPDYQLSAKRSYWDVQVQNEIAEATALDKTTSDKGGVMLNAVGSLNGLAGLLLSHLLIL